eukprot:5295194-Prymnesium_polylepis.1
MAHASHCHPHPQTLSPPPPASELPEHPACACARRRFFDNSYTGLVEALVKHLPSPVGGAEAKIGHTYSGSLKEPFVADMLSCDADGMLMVNLTKMYHTPDCENFDAFGRVLSGTLKVPPSTMQTAGGSTAPRDLPTLTCPRWPAHVDPVRQVGSTVKVLGEAYSLDDQEDSAAKTISRLWIYQSRYRVEVAEVPAGCWALIEGVEASLVKSGTVT